MISKKLLAASYRPLVLSQLANGEAYGYQIIQRIQRISGGRIRWTAGTLYPLLHRLETRGLVASAWRVAESGRERKYYRLTDKGQQALEADKREWLDLYQLMLPMWGMEPKLT